MGEIKRDKRKNLKISEELHGDLKKLAKRERTTMNGIMGVLVEKELIKGKDKNDKEG